MGDCGASADAPRLRAGTAEEHAEEALRDMYRLVDSSPVVFFRWWSAPGWPVSLVSRNVIQFGYTPEELLSGRVLFSALVHPDDLERIQREVAEHTARGAKTFQQEYRIVTRAGATRVVDGRTAVVRDASGNVVHHQGGLLDITERKRAEEALRRSDALERSRAAELEAIIGSIADGVMVYGPDSRVVRMNETARRIFGYREADLAEAIEVRMAGRPAVDETGRPIALADLPPIRALRGETVKGFVCRISPVGAAPDEFKWISSSAAPLTDAAGGIAGAVVTLTDVTERKQMEERLREADQRKSDFLAVLSHELRNPLAPIQSGIQILEREPQGSERAARAREVIQRQTAHLTRLVGDLLDVTRISRGKIELRRERIDLREVVRKSCDDQRSSFEQRGVELHYQDQGPVWIQADATRLAQVFGNLLQNAVKFTPRGGSASISASKVGGRAEVVVRDTGVGMEPSRVEEMFEPFAQAHGGLARTMGGLGLGLALVKGLVELHGGSASGRSEGPGCGTEFRVVLPLAASPQPAAEVAPVPPGATGAQVLIVEDNVDAALMLADRLRLDGHHVEVAHDGQSGLALARELGPQVVLCDIGLPDLDGYEVARALRAEPRTRSALLVAVSGYAQPEDVERAADAGFDAHLAKPPPIKELEALLSGEGWGCATSLGGDK